MFRSVTHTANVILTLPKNSKVLPRQLGPMGLRAGGSCGLRRLLTVLFGKLLPNLSPQVSQSLSWSTGRECQTPSNPNLQVSGDQGVQRQSYKGPVQGSSLQLLGYVHLYLDKSECTEGTIIFLIL